MSSEVGLNWFEYEYRHGLEAKFAFADLSRSDLGYNTKAASAFLEALREYYPADHWAVNPVNYPTNDDLALQAMLAAACRLRPEGLGCTDHVLDSCLRVARSPALSPYAILSKKVIIVPRGFLKSINTFLSTILELSISGAKLLDPEKATALWDFENIVSAQVHLWLEEPFAYRYGIFVALQPTMMAQVISDFDDTLRAAVFAEHMNRELQQMMPASHRFADLGVGELGSIITSNSAVEQKGLDLRRLVACVAIAHELGHLLVGGTAKSLEGGPHAAESFQDESLADAVGMLIMRSVKEAGFLDLFVQNRPVTYVDLFGAIAAFYAWNLSICIARLLTAGFEKSSRKHEAAMTTLTQVAGRWQKVVEILIKASQDEEHETLQNTVQGICSVWNASCAEILSMLVNSKGVTLNHDQAFAALYRLGDPKSKINALLWERSP